MLMILLAVFGGVLTTLSMIVSSTLGKKIGLIQSTIIHYIGGLIGGFLINIGLGVKYKSSTFEKVNGYIISLIYVSFLIFMAFIYVK